MLRVDASYANARSGDVAQGVIVQNSQVVSRCNDIPLDPNGGSAWCRIPVFAPGDYLFELGINGTPVASHEFVIPGRTASPPTQVVVTSQPQRVFRPGTVQPQPRPAAPACCARQQPGTRQAPARAPGRRPFPR